MFGSFKYDFCIENKTSFISNNDTADDDEFYQGKASHKSRHLVTDNQRSSGGGKPSLIYLTAPADLMTEYQNTKTLFLVQNKMD